MAKTANGLFRTAVYTVHCTLYNAVYSEQFTIYSVQCTVHTIPLSLNRLEEEGRTKPLVDNQDNRSAAEVDC